MTTFTAWKFDTADGADKEVVTLKHAQSDHLVKLIDHAVISWPEGADEPTLRHSNDDKVRGTGWGAFWGVLVGGLFFVPVLGAAAGAAIGAISKAMAALGLTDAQLEDIRAQVTPGTSLLCVVTDGADLDRLGERFHGGHKTLIATNLTDAERAVLLETFD